MHEHFAFSNKWESLALRTRSLHTVYYRLP